LGNGTGLVSQSRVSSVKEKKNSTEQVLASLRE